MTQRIKSYTVKGQLQLELQELENSHHYRLAEGRQRHHNSISPSQRQALERANVLRRQIARLEAKQEAAE